MSEAILVLNAGSSSIKFACFEPGDEGLTATLRGAISDIGRAPRLSARDTGGGHDEQTVLPGEAADHAACLAFLFAWRRARLADRRVMAVAHRIVHGGASLAAPVRVDEAVLDTLERLVPLAPLHQPHGLAGIRAARRALPATAQVACFDTAFHRTQPRVAEAFGLPASCFDDGVRRYGFHGLSCEYVAGRLAELAPAAAAGRVVVAHLGHGSSLTAIAAGRSVATSMGFSALDGVPMSTRSGSLDPGVVLHLLRQGMDLDTLEELLYRRSGLLGLSGESGDMRELLASGSPAAHFAVEYFVYRVAREVGSLAAALEGLDALVFTAGIGENSPQVRGRVCAALHWLGLDIDAAANDGGAACFSTPSSRVSVWRLPTDEESVMARHAAELAAAP